VKFDDGWLEGGQSDIYHDMYDKQFAQDMATKGSLGLADIIVEQLTPTLPSLQGEALEAWLAEQEQRQQAFSQPSTQDALALRPLSGR
jgi:flagellar protein FlgJ